MNWNTRQPTPVTILNSLGDLLNVEPRQTETLQRRLAWSKKFEPRRCAVRGDQLFRDVNRVKSFRERGGRVAGRETQKAVGLATAFCSQVCV